MNAELNRTIANLIIQELLPRLKRAGIGIDQSPVASKDIAALAKLKVAGIIDTHFIRTVLDNRLKEEA